MKSIVIEIETPHFIHLVIHAILELRKYKKELQQERLDMDERVLKSSYEWWIKLTPLWKKFVRQTSLSGYEKEDLEQECYLLLVKCLDKFDKDLGVPFESYYKIQLYGWRANQNRKKREILSLDEEAYYQVTQKPDEQIDLAKQVEDKLLVEEILRALACMDAIDQLIVTRYYLHDVPLKQIAGEVALKYKSAEFRKGKALKVLRNLL
ncbi:sigma-70 family RNA polymerase sigma factor [Cellulosilyticum sp. I15G10I2]|uniref:sigma-70 family RNA polymerase sigma factor n=1 Tax=Cellulosilyticum sp. I15G10I2 TaxID=1892843 RepID=UPI00085C6A4D|nr:sigma-70 family RNA polymerase sigma factor [Cellulosilyticum sp. I15G10I2]